MNRRDAMKSVAAAGAVWSLGAMAQPKEAAKDAKKAVAPSGIGAHKDVYDAAVDCLKVGRECLDHCIRQLSTGDTMMAECAATTRAMLATCDAVVQLAMLDSKYFKDAAALCAKACRDCEAACKKHSGHHAECKACMESCKRCAEACEKA
ncbi:MAG: four-helix bundle copper-binding protein [Myxococcaceae bacterium]